MTYFCPICWAEVTSLEGECPQCRADLGAESTERLYTEKLISALRHPDPQTVKRVVWILGARRDKEAVRPLLDLLRSTSDIYLSAAACDALGEIGDPAALPDLQAYATRGSVIVRQTARRAMEMIKQKQTTRIYDQ